MLGIHINIDNTECNKNFEEIIQKVKQTCERWINRKQTLFGKCLTINTLIGSLFVYKMSTMTNLSKKQIKEVETIIREYLWSGKKAKIALETLQKDKSQGGTRLVNLTAKQDAIKVSNIFKLENDLFLEKCAYEELNPVLKDWIWRCNLSNADAKKLFPKKNYWCDTLQAWSKINFKIPATKDAVETQTIWLNSHLRINDTPFFWPAWYRKGIVLVQDLMREDNSKVVFKTEEELGVNWLDLKTLHRVIPKEWIQWLKTPNTDVATPELYTTLGKSKNITRQAYNMLIFDPGAVLKYYAQWCEDGLNELDYDFYVESFTRLYSSTRITKYRDFQYRLLLGKIFLNKQLHEWGIQESPKCSLCNQKDETLVHFFWECEQTQEIIGVIRELCSKNNITIELNEYTFILNRVHKNKFHIVNFICIFIKQYLYRQKCAQISPTKTGCYKEIEYAYLIEKANSNLDRTYSKFVQKWGTIFPHLYENH